MQSGTPYTTAPRQHSGAESTLVPFPRGSGPRPRLSRRLLVSQAFVYSPPAPGGRGPVWGLPPRPFPWPRFHSGTRARCRIRCGWGTGRAGPGDGAGGADGIPSVERYNTWRPRYSTDAPRVNRSGAFLFPKSVFPLFPPLQSQAIGGRVRRWESYPWGVLTRYTPSTGIGAAQLVNTLASGVGFRRTSVSRPRVGGRV